MFTTHHANIAECVRLAKCMDLMLYCMRQSNIADVVLLKFTILLGDSKWIHISLGSLSTLI